MSEIVHIKKIDRKKIDRKKIEKIASAGLRPCSQSIYNNVKNVRKVKDIRQVMYMT